MENKDIYTDAELVSQLSEGSDRAFAEVYQRYYQRILYFARRYVPEADAQDITAEVFIQVWRKKGEFPTLEKLSSFLFVTTRNRCYDVLRHQQMKAQHQPELINRLEAAGEHDFFLEQVRAELIQLLRREIDQLPEKMREVFLLSFLEGMKPAEIAWQLGISVKTVSNQKLTAIKLLKTAMKQHPLEMVLLFLLQLERLQ